MDLTVEDVANLLSVPENFVEGLVDQGKIRSYKINGNLRFDPLEIEDWVMSHELEKSIKDQSQDGSQTSKGTQQFSLYRAIFRGGVHLNIKGRTKEEIILETTQRIAPKLELDANIVSELLLDRERLAPTALSYGIAVPHTREIVLPNSHNVIALVYPSLPISYGSLDGKDVHAMFFLFASDNKQHLHLLAKIAHLANDPGMVEFLKTKPSLAELLGKIKEWELTLFQD